jgi:hypothetical protein
MNLRIRRTWTLVGLAALGALFTNCDNARAGSVVGIVIKSGGSHQAGDPTYNYYFDVELTAGSTLLTGGYFTVYDLPGVMGSSPTQQPNSWNDSLQLVGLTPLNTIPPIPDDPAIWNVTWIYTGNPITGRSPEGTDLGTFVITTGELTYQPLPTLYYVATLDGINYTDQGTVKINAIVPEPSSVILLVAGVGILPLLRLSQQQRRRRR